MEVSGQLHAPATLSPGKEVLIPIGWVGSEVYYRNFTEISTLCYCLGRMTYTDCSETILTRQWFSHYTTIMTSDWWHTDSFYFRHLWQRSILNRKPSEYKRYMLITTLPSRPCGIVVWNLPSLKGLHRLRSVRKQSVENVCTWQGSDRRM
jgi:hypothetical protein